MKNFFDNIQGYVFCGIVTLLLCGSAVGSYYNAINFDKVTAPGALMTQSFMQHGYVLPLAPNPEAD